MSGLSRCDGLDPAVEQRERHVHGREEEHQEDGHLHHRAGLHRAEPHRHAARPQQPAHVDQQRERVHAEHVDRPAEDVHPGEQGDHGEKRRRDRPAHERRERVADDDSRAIRSREQQPPREAALEVARDPEPGEHAAEGRRLDEHEAELERGVARLEVEAGHVARPARGRPRTR